MRTSPATKRSRPPGTGFTLVELMVSMAVLSLLVIMLTSTFNTAGRAWTQGQGNAERQRSARALADFIGAELQGALQPFLPVGAAAAGTQANLQFVINPSSGGMTKFQNGDAIFWQAPIATERSFGDIAEVGYFVRWDNGDPTPEGTNPAPAPAPAPPVLCRFFVNPSHGDPTTGDAKANPDFLIYSKTQWLTDDLVEKVASARKEDSYAGLFAENVLGLWVRAYGLDGKELPKNFDSRVGYRCDFKQGGQAWSEQRYLPSHVKVSLAQIDSHHVARLAPVRDAVKALVRDSSIRDAGQFQERLQQAAASRPGLAALLPGIRIYTTDVYLENAR